MTAVTVVAPFVVFSEGKRYGPGEHADVPAELANEWLKRGWVEKQQKPAKRASTRTAPDNE